MAVGKGKRWWLIAMVALVVVIAGGIVGFRVALGDLKGKVQEALGPGSEITGIRVGWTSVDVDGLEIKGPAGWPATDTLRAARIAVVPSLRSLLSREFRVQSVTIVKPYLSALRTKDGRLQIVPSLLTGASGKSAAAPSPASVAAPLAPAAGPPIITISDITLSDGLLEFFDATVAQPPLEIRLDQIRATVGDMVIPGLTGKTRLEVAGVLKGPQHDGSVGISGWIDISSKDSSLHITMRSVDIVMLQPYLAQAHATSVQSGTLDLDLQSDVRKNRLRAPGRLTIAGLELAPARGPFATFMGVPRDALVAALNQENKITVSFMLEGDLSNPHFSLNDTLSTVLASSLAKKLGVSLDGIGKSVEGMGEKGLGAAAEAAKESLQRLFGGHGKHGIW
jgi:hypothetical protein